MVYTQICEWLDDFIGDDPPCELIDVWDLTEWLHESEILDVFQEIVIPSFKNKKSRDDAENILHSLLWEYYLFRRSGYISKLVADASAVGRLQTAAALATASTQQSLQWHREKRDLLTASEFSCILDTRRMGVLRSKVANKLSDGERPQTVFLSRGGKLNASAWGVRYEEVVRLLYEVNAGCKVQNNIPRLRHPVLGFLAASPDGLVIEGPAAGRLLEIKAPLSRILEDDVVPCDYYCQMQIQMEVCDVGSADYCECRLAIVKDGVFTESATAMPNFVGSLAVVGEPDDYKTWEYKYSPLFPNTLEGRAGAVDWKPLLSNEGLEILELQTWEVQDWQVITVARNKRWWANVGFPEYQRFLTDVYAARADPMYLIPKSFDTIPEPMFLDD